MAFTNQRLKTEPEAYIRLIKEYLEGYLSSDIAKELIQNADDAKAHNIDFIIFRGENCKDNHAILDQPALAVINDGPYTTENHNAISNIIGGTKDSDSAQVGRFGLGLKSVYNICELFYYLGYDGYNREINGSLLNPWDFINDGQPYESYNDKKNEVNGLERLQKQFDKHRFNISEAGGFVLWLPLASSTSDYSFTDRIAPLTVKELYHEVFMERPFELYLAQSANLQSITLYEASNLESTPTLIFQYIKNAQGYLQRANNIESVETSYYRGQIEYKQGNDTLKWCFYGVQCFQPTCKMLEEVKNHDNWPKIPSGVTHIKLKAQNHAAITVLHKQNYTYTKNTQNHFLWASFLPLNEKENYSIDSWNVVLHANFLLSSDRKNILGITKSNNRSDIKEKWNEIITNELLMPLFPEFLSSLDDNNLAIAIINAIHNNLAYDTDKTLYKMFQNAITSKNVYAKILDSKGVSWRCMSREEFDSKEKYKLSLPNYLETQFINKLKENKEEAIYISAEDESLLPSKCTFNEIPEDTLRVILNLFLGTIHKPEDLSSDISWLEIFWEKTKETYTPWGEFIIQLIDKGFFSIVKHAKELIELIRNNYPKQNLRLCNLENFHDAIKNLAKERVLTPDLIYLPIGESEDYVIASEKKNLIEKHFTYLLEKKSEKLLDNKLLNLLRQDLEKVGANPKEKFYDRKCVLVANKLISYKELDVHISEYRIFKKPNESQREKWINTYLNNSLAKETYVVAKEDGALASIPEITEQSIAESILINDINKDSDKKKLIEILFNGTGEISSDTKNALRKLICAKEVERLELIVYPKDENYSFLKELDGDFSAKTVFLESEACKDLTRSQIDILEIKDIEKNSDTFLTKIVEVLLNGVSPWENAEHINTCLKNLQSIETLGKSLLEKPWIPNDKGEGIPLGKIFIESSYSEKLTQLNFVQKMQWAALPEEEISKYIPSEPKEKLLNRNEQLSRFKTNCKEFFEKENSEQYALFPNSFPINEELVTTFLENCSFACDSIKLLQIAKDYKLGIVDFANFLPKNVTHKRQKEILTHFSDVEKLKQKNIRDFYEAYLTSCARENENVFSENPDLLLPTRSDKKHEQWKKCREILITDRDDGNSFQLLIKSLWNTWEQDGVIANLEKLYNSSEYNNEDIKNSSYSYEFLKKYFKNYKAENARISLFLFLLHSNNDVPTKVQDLANELFSNEKWSDELGKLDFSPNIPITIKPQPPSKETMGVSFSGKDILIVGGKSRRQSLFAKPPIYITQTTSTSSHWEIYFKTESDGRNAPVMTNENFEKTLYNTIDEWLEEYKRKDKKQENNIQEVKNSLKTWWKDSSQTQISVESTCNVLRARMPQILDVLKLESETELGSLRREYDEKLQNKNSASKEKLEAIWEKAKADKAVGKALCAKISENGYRTSSVLFELLQNADDAIMQAKELSNFRKTNNSDLLNSVKIQYRNTGHQINFLHNGRPINDGGDHNKEWESDLRNMINFNVSYKNPQNDSSSTTGMFGLGFKSVHLISEEPEIYSGNLYFIIKNTLFPESKARTENKDSSFSTQFILPLKNEIKVEDVFSKLNDVYKIIPVTCKGINKLDIESDSDKIKTYSVEYEPKTLLFCADEKSWWKVCYDCNVLVFETTVICAGKEQLFSLVFNVDTQNEQVTRVTIFKNTPFLWNTMPTQEEWECKYVFNGFFKLNPGRTHVDIQDSDTIDHVKLVGESLGKGLCELYEIKKGDWNEQVWADLWNILSVGIASDGEKTDRSNVLRALHCNGNGLSYWTQTQKLAASGLEKPFSSLTKLGDEVFIDESYVKDGIKKIIKENKVNTSDFINFNKARILRMLGHEEKNIQLNREIDFYDTILFRFCKNKLSASVFHLLLPALEEWPESIATKNLLVKTQTGDYKEIQQVLMARPKFHINVIEYEEEFLRAEFAPPENILHKDYLLEITQIKFFMRLRWRHIIDSKLLMLWALTAKEENKEDVLYYIEHGEFGTAIVDKLGQADDKSWWIFNFKDVYEIAQGKFNRALFLLFPPKYEPTNSTEMLEEKPYEPNTAIINSVAEIEAREKEIANERRRDKCWPDSFTDKELLSNLNKEGDESLEAWCTLLLLGCLQSMGRQNSDQHRGFIESLKQAEEAILWQNFTSKNGYKNSAQWMTSIDLWFDRQTNVQRYSEWMHYFIYMYQINKYISRYIGLFKSLPMQVKGDNFDINEYFAPRVNSSMTGGGKRWDIPPLPLKIGKYWVIRELARLDFEEYRSANILKYCWIPKESVLRIFSISSLESNDIKHRLLVEKLKEINKGTIPHFNHNFDLALEI